MILKLYCHRSKLIMEARCRFILIVLVLIGNVRLVCSQEYLTINDKDILIHIPAVLKENIAERRTELNKWGYLHYEDTINKYYVRYYQDTQMFGGLYNTYCGISNYSINNLISECKKFIENKKNYLTVNNKYERRLVIKHDMYGQQTDIVVLKYTNQYEEPFGANENMVELEFVFLHEKFQFTGILSIYKEKCESETIEDDIEWAKQFFGVHLEIPSDYLKDAWW